MLDNISDAIVCHQTSVWKFSLNSLWPSDAIKRQGTESTLAQVMACCLTAPSHYLNQCWLIISKVLWHSSEDLKIPISKARLKIPFLESHPDLPGANELNIKSGFVLLSELTNVFNYLLTFTKQQQLWSMNLMMIIEINYELQKKKWW